MKTNHYFENREIKQHEFPEKITAKSSFIDCQIINCDFQEKKLPHLNFVDCIFSNCNLSMTEWIGTHFNNVTFKDCKVIGCNFSKCSDILFKVRFENCNLDFSTFEQLKASSTIFINCTLKGVDFSHANLEKSDFINTDLLDAQFFHTNIRQCNFSTAYNYRINPTINNVKQAIFSENGISGLLLDFDIKIC